MLRIHFTDGDLARVHLAREPDPVWETLLGLHHLTTPRCGLPVFTPWRRDARARVAEGHLAGPVRMLSTLAPASAGYWPDFLTPSASADGMEAALEALRATPQPQLRQEMDRLAETHPLPGWAHRLAGGEPHRMEEVATAFRLVHRTIITPDWTGAARTTEADRALRTRVLCDRGVHGLLDSFRPLMDWQPPVLHVRYPEDRDLHLGGRGLRLIPSHFCWKTPIALADASLPQVLAYPVTHPPAWAPSVTRDRRPEALATLLGRTRARVLAALDTTATTGEVAQRLNISAPSASEHITALREVSLAHSQRTGSQVLHTLTPLGTALLRGELPPHQSAVQEGG
ncbi:winged helix-turn-helix domain-containing protein [Streptomyces europaeiscabiei]|uniref:winged helix-turn-helix domain-containing protein n=1 Tax=Streptomyces europaeiscabiei TaxID=146819 RepID=UPI0029B4B59D|nr:winged helix-turn-helix domain-containing protein [Streptomyces europaeiscabiei]MDX2530933.1 winged helix-turn-helix domain-containing protein [Streptomyces europaeiscabiei]MDX3781941.1 winged helix-turn-helix domain-containing protein [Streptomyces europaeiscabiei]